MFKRPYVKIASIYLAISIAWILLSDRFLFLFTNDIQIMTKLQTYKGWVFVIVTSYILYSLIRKEIIIKDKLRDEIMKVNEALSETNSQLMNEIEERKAAELSLIETRDELERASHVKTQFLANMSHELRTPMNGILGSIQYMQLKEETTEEQYRLLEIAKKSSLALTNTLANIMEISRLELGSVKLVNQCFNIHNLIYDLYSLFRPAAMEKDIAFNYEVDNDIPKIFIGDSVKLNQILISLVGNAVKFTDKGFVNIKLDKLENKDDFCHLRFSVLDTGVGISEKDKEKLFKIFSQVDDSYNKRYEGAGLGLAICSRLIKLFDGSIGVESELNVGSRFYFDIWLQEDTGYINQSKPIEQKKYIEQRNRVLVVEDDDVNQLVLTKYLKAQGYTVNAVVNGQEAIELLEREAYDLVLMDIQMPVMNGIEATRALRSRGIDVPIVAVTAYAMDKDKETFLSAGADDYIAKPFDFNELSAKIEKYM
ncbi:MAG: response regulator [Bacillota bacterium]